MEKNYYKHLFRWDLMIIFTTKVTFLKRKSISLGIRKTGNGKRKKRAVKRSNTSFKDLSEVLEDHGRNSMLSFFKFPTYFSVTYFRY